MKKICSALIALLTVFCLFACQHTSSRQTLRQIANVEPRKGFVTFDKLDPKKQTVCALTLNSDNEILTFQKHLSPKDFQFVEFVTDEENWFEVATQAKIKCDMVVISGHFGGAFFGDKGQLSLEELETFSCNQDNEGIFHKAKEVFLFGCNTLAGKTQDHRTPEEYVRVLVADGFSLEQATQIAAFRYSPIGSTFHDRMAQVFSGVPRIYGFSSVGPSGANVQDMLARYLKKKPNYSQYLHTIDTKTNSAFLKALASTVVVQTKGAEHTSKQELPRCVFNNPQKGERAKLQLARDLLKDPKRRLVHLAEVSDFLLLGKRTGANRKYELSMMQDLYGDHGLRSDMNKILDLGLKGYPTLRLQMLDIGLYMGWLKTSDAKRISQDVVGDFYKNGLTIEEKDQLCSMGRVAGRHTTYGMVKDQLRNIDVMDSFYCTRPQDQKIHWALLEVFKKDSNQEVRENAGSTLQLSFDQLAEDIRWELVTLLKTEKNPQIRLGAISILSSQKNIEPKILSFIIDTLKTDRESEVRRIAAYSLEKIAGNRPQIQWILFESMRSDNDEYVRDSAGRSLRNTEKLDPTLLRPLMEVVKTHSDNNIRLLAIETLGRLQVKDPKVYQFLLDLMESSDENIMYNAGYALAALKPESPMIHQALVNMMKSHPRTETRAMAIEVIGQLYLTDPKIHAALLHLMKTDKSASIRRATANAFQYISTTDPKILKALVDLLKNDKDSDVQFSAYVALYKNRPNDPEAIDLMRKFQERIGEEDGSATTIEGD